MWDLRCEMCVRPWYRLTTINEFSGLKATQEQVSYLTSKSDAGAFSHRTTPNSYTPQSFASNRLIAILQFEVNALPPLEVKH